jgi:hypothetical protein
MITFQVNSLPFKFSTKNWKFYLMVLGKEITSVVTTPDFDIQKTRKFLIADTPCISHVEEAVIEG